MTEDGTVVRLDLEATTRDLAVARSVTATMAARADLTLDQLEDARLAVDEAAAQLVADAPAGGRLAIEFLASDGQLTVTLAAPSASGRTLAQDTFAWTVLSALASHVESSTDTGMTSLLLVLRRSMPVEA